MGRSFVGENSRPIGKITAIFVSVRSRCHQDCMAPTQKAVLEPRLLSLYQWLRSRQPSLRGPHIWWHPEARLAFKEHFPSNLKCLSPFRALVNDR